MDMSESHNLRPDSVKTENHARHRRKGILALLAGVGAENACHVGVGLGSRGSYSYSIFSLVHSTWVVPVHDTGKLVKLGKIR